MNTRCPPKRVPSAARFFTLCRLTVQPPQIYSVRGQRSSGQLTGQPAGARPDYRGRWYGNNTKSYTVRVGDYHTLVSEEYEEEYGIQQIVLHSNYKPDRNDNDLALVQLVGRDRQCAKFSSHVMPACLPLRKQKALKAASNCYITGWGDTGRAYSKTLQQAPIPLLPKRLCEERYRGQFTGRMLCAGNVQEGMRVDSCQGDSGGPLVCERPGGSWVVYGVTSWGHGCRVQDSLGVYTKVSAFVPWIKRVIKL
ncbi:UNVERIFIED_CONTAM: hypothetical protein FKN15_071049 [Acipenser sinensis]